MQIIVKASEGQKLEWLQKGTVGAIQVHFLDQADPTIEADAYFDLLFETEGSAFSHIQDKPVFVNAVLQEAKTLPDNYIRINAWPGFINRPVIEIALHQEGLIKQVSSIFNNMGWDYEKTPDIPGMIAARALAMIINEAFFTIGEDISNESSIDLAMQLGTNYPKGPFAWAKQIGENNIYQLLLAMAKADMKYEPAPAFRELMKKN